MLKNKLATNYSIGLDIGTQSVGWAVIDEQFHLLKKGKTHLWGARTFDEAQSAAERRANRSSRRRYNKRRERIFLLQSIMEKMVCEVDPTFFMRLRNSSFLDREDKKELLQQDYKSNYNLFTDPDYTDVQFYKDYRTIYHLRNYLCNCQKKADPRFIYLAIHHILKYRGNFLYEGREFKNDKTCVEDNIFHLLNQLCEENDFDIDLDDELIQQMTSIFVENISKKEKVEKCLKLFDLDSTSKPVLTNLFNGFVGNQSNLSKMFCKEALKTSDDSDIKIKISDSDYASKRDELANVLDDDKLEIIDEMESIFNWIQLQQILGGNEGSTISEIMIKNYEKHKADLKQLKKLIKEYDSELYRQVFRDKNPKVNNYYNYIHHPGKTTQESFYKYLKGILTKINSAEAKQILKRIENDDFLLKQNSSIYGSIPYQMQLQELVMILENQSKYYPDLMENKDKIIKILEFRIPYFYGPLDGNDKFGWLKKQKGKENERILPWNHEEVVDADETAVLFIERLTSNCTYLPSEPVMPKNSLTCNKYEVLSELNKIRINGKLISTDMKLRMIEELFLKHKKVKEKHLIEWLKKEEFGDIQEITGYQKDKEFASSMNVWIDFRNILGEINDSNYQMIESIVKDVTIFNDAKILKRRLKKLYALTDVQIDKILKLNYKGWSSLSEKLINGLYADNCVSSSATILDVMEEKNLVLMEIINDEKLGYDKLIQDEFFKDHNECSMFEEVDALAGSPAIKKGIRQSLLVVDEISRYMKHNPSNVFIEFAREEKKKTRTQSRAAQLEQIYRNITINSDEDIQLLKELSEFKDTKDMGERLYLYFSQMGKCMYSNKPLQIDQLSTYQIDHILPQSLVKDDSLDNKVLVISKENQRKRDDLLVPEAIRAKQYIVWKNLLDKKLISKKKFSNLTRSKMDDQIIDKFINRQLVETRQIIKHVTNIISNHYSGTKVFAIRSNLTHGYREKYEIPKVRELNQCHHAHDAYIACIIGLFVKKALPKANGLFDYNSYLYFAKKKLNNHDHSGFVLNSMNYQWCDRDTGEVLWDPEMLADINKKFEYKDYFMSKKLERNDGSLFKITIVPSDKNSEKGVTEASVAVNKFRNDVHKYGGYTQISYVFYAVEGKKKKKDIRKIVNVPYYLYSKTEDERIQYIENTYEIQNVRIIKEVLKYQLIEIEGGLYYVASATELQNAKQLMLNKSQTAELEKIVNALKKNNFDNFDESELKKLYADLIEKMLDHYPKYVNIAKKLSEKTDDFYELSIEEKCRVILEILNVMSAGATNGNLKAVGGSDRSGRLCSVSIDLDKTVFYYQSVTGIYCKKIKL